MTEEMTEGMLIRPALLKRIRLDSKDTTGELNAENIGQLFVKRPVLPVRNFQMYNKTSLAL